MSADIYPHAFVAGATGVSGRTYCAECTGLSIDSIHTTPGDIMYAKIAQPILKSALTDVSRAVARRDTLPVLQNVKVTIADGHVTLDATDLRTAIGLDIIAESDGAGSFTMPARRALDFVKSADKSDVITIELLADSVALRHGRASITLPVIPAEEYPLSLEPGPIVADVDGPAFLDALRRALVYAADERDARPILSAVHFRPRFGAIELASADNYRLQTSGIDCHWMAPDVEPFTVNVDSLKIAAAILKSADVISLHRAVDGPASYRLDLSAGDVRIACRIIDGTYPNYESVIPAETPGALFRSLSGRDKSRAAPNAWTDVIS